MREADVQHACDRLCEMLGFWPVKFDQGYRPGGKRHGSTRQTRGIPDRLYLHDRKRLALWREIKREGGKLSRYQRRWHMVARGAGCDVGMWDSVEAAARDLAAYGFRVNVGPETLAAGGQGRT